MILSGLSLGERQRELNARVKEAVENNIDPEDNQSTDDVSQLFKINVASSYKDVETILLTLQSGDSLYISNAIKLCSWIYDDEYDNIINPQYLEEKIFPYMSVRMRNKFLTAVSMNVRNKPRNHDFYEYCRKNAMQDLANKFLIYVPDSVKLDMILNGDIIPLVESNSYFKLRFFIDGSFDLAEALLQRTEQRLNDWKTSDILHMLRYLYFYSEERFMALFEKYYDYEKYRSFLGQRISKSILKKHKFKLFKTKTYLYCLNKNVIVRYLTTDEIKQLLVLLLPTDDESFWNENYCHRYDFLFSKLKIPEKFEFIKNAFINKYGNVPFEMSRSFYDLKYYLYMSEEQKEEWAMLQAESYHNILDKGQEYKWYRFTSLQRSIKGTRGLMMFTSDPEQRKDIFKVLAKSTRNYDGLEKLYSHYYENNISYITMTHEKQTDIIQFLDATFTYHNILNIPLSCWEVLNKIFYKIGVYDFDKWNATGLNHLREIAFIMFLNFNQTFPNNFRELYIENISHIWVLSKLHSCSLEQKEKVYDYLITLIIEKIEELENLVEKKDEIRKRISFIHDLMNVCNKTECEIPDIVTRIMFSDDYFFVKQEEKLKVTSVNDLLRFLKENKSLLEVELPTVNICVYGSSALTTLLQKIRTYFYDDLRLEFLQYFKNKLVFDTKSDRPRVHKRGIFTAVFGIFQLADEEYKSEFMNKYAPCNPKIDHKNTNREILFIQEAICRFACYARPFVDLSDISKYITGDYINFCLPMFNVYMSHLPRPRRIKFVESLLDAPPSIQKHGLRCAFLCFEQEQLIEQITRVWRKSKDTSLRMVLYTNLLNYILIQDEQAQMTLFDFFLNVTLDLYKDDHADVLDILFNTVRMIPAQFRGTYIETSWSIVTNGNKFPTDSRKTIERKKQVLTNMRTFIDLIRKPFLEEFTYSCLNQLLVENKSSDIIRSPINNSKWNLVVAYIVRFNVDEKARELIKLILAECLKKWDKIATDEEENIYIFRHFFYHFIDIFLNEHEKKYYEHTSKISYLFEVILNKIQLAIPLHEIYGVVWNLRIRMIADEVGEPFSDIKKAKMLVMKFAVEVSELIEEFVRNEIYYTCFRNELVLKVENNLGYLYDRWGGEGIYDTFLEHREVMNLYASQGFVAQNTLETYLLAVHLLPLSLTTRNTLEFEDVVTVINDIKEVEVKYEMYKKFIKSGFHCKLLKKNVFKN